MVVMRAQSLGCILKINFILNYRSVSSFLQLLLVLENRRKQIEEMTMKNINKTSIMYDGPNGKHQLSNDEVIKVIQQLQETNKQLIQSLREKNKKIQELEDKIANIEEEPFEIDDDLLSQVNDDN